MKLTGSMASYPVFPNWVFEGKLELTRNIATSIINEVAEKSTPQPTHFGSLSALPQQTDGMFKLSKMLGRLFIDNVVSHYHITDVAERIESSDPQVIRISPTRNVPVSVRPQRWYSSMIFLSTEKKGSHLYFELLDSKLYATPKKILQSNHIISPENFKVVFWPSHIPWGFTPNMSSSDTFVFSNHFIIKA